MMTISPRGLRKRGADRSPFAAVPFVVQDADRQPPRQLGQHLARAVVHDHDFFVHRDGQPPAQWGFHRVALVVDRHPDREECRLQGRASTEATGGDATRAGSGSARVSSAIHETRPTRPPRLRAAKRRVSRPTRGLILSVAPVGVQ